MEAMISNIMRRVQEESIAMQSQSSSLRCVTQRVRQSRSLYHEIRRNGVEGTLTRAPDGCMQDFIPTRKLKWVPGGMQFCQVLP